MKLTADTITDERPSFVRVGQRVSILHNGGYIIGRVAVTDSRWAWLRLESANGVRWPVGCIPDSDALYPVTRARCAEILNARAEIK